MEHNTLHVRNNIPIQARQLSDQEQFCAWIKEILTIFLRRIILFHCLICGARVVVFAKCFYLL